MFFFSSAIANYIFRILFEFTMPGHSVDRYGRARDRRVRSPSYDTDGRPRSYSRRSRSRERSASRRSGSRNYRSRRRSRSRGETRSRKRSRSRSRSRHHHSTAHAKFEADDDDEESDNSDRDDFGESRSKRLKKVDVRNPLSAFETKTKTKLSHIQASTFCKDKWNVIRGMDVKTGKFLTEDRPGPDDWQKMAKSDRIIKKWSGDPAFSDTKLDNGLASVVPKNVSKEETQLLNTQRAMGAMGHMVLSATEGFSALYKKTEEFVNKIIGDPLDTNPEYVEGEEDEMVPKYIFSQKQNSMYEEFLSMQREWQIDVSDPLANAARTAAAYHIKILANRREKVISKVRTGNPRAATAISKIPPSSSGMFGGDATQLENVVKLAKNLSGSGKQSFQGFNASASSSTTSNFRGRGTFRGGGNQGSFKGPPKENKFGSDRGRGRGGNSRGRGR